MTGDDTKRRNMKAATIAFKVVPEYKCGVSCTGAIAKRWNAAYEAAVMAMEDDK